MDTETNSAEGQKLVAYFEALYSRLREAQFRISLLAPRDVNRTVSEIMAAWKALFSERKSLDEKAMQDRLEQMHPAWRKLRDQLRASLGGPD